MDISTLLVTLEQQEQNISQLELELAQLQSPGATFDKTEKVSGRNIVPVFCHLIYPEVGFGGGYDRDNQKGSRLEEMFFG